MAKQLKIQHEGREYILEFTRKSVSELEKAGFIASDVTTKPVSTLPALFSGAFRANHRYLKQEIRDEIFDNMNNKNELIGKLAEMYNEPLEELFEDKDEDSEGNATWTASW